MRWILSVILIAFWLLPRVQAAEAPPLPVYEVRRITIPPKIDGLLKDACWANAAKMTGFTQVVRGEGSAKYPTEAMACYDLHNLYLGIVCAETEPLETLVATHVGHDSEVWADDGVEIFIDPCGSLATYYHLSVNSRAARYDAKGMDKSWDCRWETAAQRGAGQYTIEAAINLTDLGKVPRYGDVWGFNLCRDHNANGRMEWSCWSNTLGGFHNPSRFGRLVFDNCRAALKRYVEENDADMRRTADRIAKLVQGKGNDRERARVAEAYTVAGDLRAEAKSKAPLAASRWSELCGNWDALLRSLEDLELDVKFRLLFED